MDLGHPERRPNTVGVPHMTTDGENIRLIFGELKRVFESTGLMLITGDEYMKKAGWVLRTGLCISVAYTPGESGHWLPWYAFRVYKHDRCPHVVAFVAALFDDGEGRDLVPEPLVSA